MMITLTNPTVDELQAVITAMAKVHPELEVSGTLTIARATAVDADDAPAVTPRIEITTDQTAEQITERVTTALASKPVDPPREKPRRTIDKPKRTGKTMSPRLAEEDRMALLRRVAELDAEAAERNLIGQYRYQHIAKGIGRTESAMRNLIPKAIEAGLLERKTSNLGAIERRPFDADAARMRAIGAI